AEAAAGPLGCPVEAVLTCSTGVIGVQLDVSKIAAAMPDLVAALGGPRSGGSEAPAQRRRGQVDPRGLATAILTTDTVTKVAHGELVLPGAARPVRLFGVAKGSGMIHPNMATTLGFVCTDAAIEPE